MSNTSENLPTEEWRPAPSFPNYEVSSLGRVRRVTTATSTKAGRVLKASLHYRGYYQHGLGRDGRTHTVRLNRLVCETFHGFAPSQAHQAAHRDGDTANNAASNLYWATPLDNAADKERHGNTMRGRKHPQAKLDDDAARRIVDMLRSGDHPKAIAGQFGVSEGLIRHIGAGRNWRHATGF